MGLSCVRWTTLAVGVLLAWGCGESSEAGEGGAADGGISADGGGPGGDTGAPTWHRDIAPLMAQHCAGCHTEGGAGPFALDTYDAVKRMANPARNAIEAGRMPPWQPADDCRPLRDPRVMPPADVARFAAWVEAGAPEGDAADAPRVEAQTVDLGPPDLMGQPFEPYVASTDRPDDYRCLPLDLTFDADTYVRATHVVPGDAAVVHHVLVFVVPPERVADLEALDAGEAGPGYTCFGGSGLGTAGPMAAWVPGAVANVAEDGRATRIVAGSRLVMQVHYNVLAADPSPDLTTLELHTYDEPQPYVLTTQPQAGLDLHIPAGDADVVYTRDFVNRRQTPLTVVAVAPHMHVLGERIRVDVVRADDSTECVVDIPAWDFNWQQSYHLAEPLVVQPGEAFRLTCAYDNSAANQPVVNGEQLTARDVTWGEGTLDEMCLNYITVVEPLDAPVEGCGAFTTCRAACGDPNDFLCLADCLGADTACAQCALPGIVGEGGCVRDDCLPELAAAGDCVRGCLVEAISGGGLGACMANTCPEPAAALQACMTPVLAAGGCDAAIAGCAVE